MDILKKLKKINPYGAIAGEGLSSDIHEYYDTGSYLFNALLSGDMFKGFPDNRIVGLAGPKSSGKTYITLSILTNYLNADKNNRIIYFDSEGAVDSDVLDGKLLNNDKFLHMPVENLEDFKNQISQTIDIIRADRLVIDEKKTKLLKGSKKDKEEAKLLNYENFFFVLDSLGMLESEKWFNDSLKNHSATDMGLNAKLIKSIFRAITLKLNVLRIPMIVTNHPYANPTNAYAEKGLSGGDALKFAASIIIMIAPSKDRDSDKKVLGSIMKLKAIKSRIVKEQSEVEANIDFTTGLNKYYGLLNYSIEKGLVKKDGNSRVFPTGEVLKIKEIRPRQEELFNDDLLKKINIELLKELPYKKYTFDEETDKVV